MKPKLLIRSTELNKSLLLGQYSGPHFLKVWHYHPELELVYVKKSTGTRFVGDSIKKFEENDLVLIGENLPHMWQNDSDYFESSSKKTAEAIAIHFNLHFAGKEFLALPEMDSIAKLLEKAKRGLSFKAKKPCIIEALEKMFEVQDLDRLIMFIQLLKSLSEETDAETLSSAGFVDSFKMTDNRKFDKVYEFIIGNFNHEITLDQVADLANMNVSSFCRYFKKTTDKTFSHYLNEVRIGYACRLLMENKYNISETCYMCGFNNISNFNRQFKNIVQMSPSEYLKIHKSLWNGI